jgi:23S rRNA (pseudouridine1915-N3)-methyltransferase
MKIKLLVIGKTKKAFLVEGENEYLKRLAKYISFEKTEIPDLKNAKNLSEAQVKTEEGKLILSKLDKSGLVILLDERGKTYSSLSFAKWLQDEMNRGHKNITFVVGGAYGFSDEVYKAAHGRLSLSGMTLSHQMIRLFFIEQVYRAFAILNNEPYHHE